MALATDSTKRQRDRAVERIENDTALVLDGRESLRQLALKLRALERRGLLDEDEAIFAARDVARIRRALEVAQQLCQEWRGDLPGQR